MRLVQLDPADPQPLHEQVAAVIRRAVTVGESAPGDRLPPARDIAAALGVNTNTVLRALRALREERLVEFRRGRGITVAQHADSRSELVEQARALVRLAKSRGFRRDELIKLIRELS